MLNTFLNGKRGIYLSLGCLTAIGAIAACSNTTPAKQILEPTNETAQAPAEPEKKEWSLDRTVLPIHEPPVPLYDELDARNVTPPKRFQVEAPEGAPNVVIVLIDDMGFGQPSTFGGGISMPTLDNLAAEGLSYNQFHTTALCSPTRMALKTGRNHHTANTGSIMETATSFPGNTGQLPNDVAPLAEMLRLNGYSTAAFGKWHETAVWEISTSGPFDRWPTHQGFDKFYGFLGGETNQWSPMIYDGVTPIETPRDPDYHFTTDMTDQAVAWTRAQKSLTPDKPFFVYFAPGATHAPHHAPKAWIEKYKGKFDKGWDAYREETLARQIKLGVVPPGTKLAPKPPGLREWESLTPEERRYFSHQMEVFAGFAEHTDHEIGRLVEAVRETGQLDNTVFIYIAGDNGSSAEGGIDGLLNEMTYFNGVPEDTKEAMKKMDHWGDPTTYPHFSASWAVAGDTPFTWTKQVASSYGGTRNGMVIRWPAGIKSKGELRSQWHHVVDIAPTILEAAKLPFPHHVNGLEQKPFEGSSMAYTFDDAKAKDQHLTQYFEIFGNRGIYHEGWLAGTLHRIPWETKMQHTLQEDVWELYDTRTDFSLVNNLAASNPEKLKEMQAIFHEEAKKHHVLPIDDRVLERLNASLVGRPDLMDGRTSLTVYPGMDGMLENAFINVKNRSVIITADIEIPKKKSEGVLIAQGGRFAGWSLYIKDGKPAYAYNYLGIETTTISSPIAIHPGKAQIQLAFDYDGGGLGKGGKVTLSVNDTVVASGRIERTVPMIFSAEDGADVGMDGSTPVTSAYSAHDNAFTGHIEKINITVK